MMPSYSILIVTIVILSSLVSGLPNVNRLGIRSDSISQSNSEYLSASSNKTPLSRYGRRGIFRTQQPRPGVACDGTFYKQTRVANVASQACKDAVKSSGIVTSKNPLAKFFRRPHPLFPALRLFPQETETLYMVRITRGFFSFQRLKAFFRIGKRDFIVFTAHCRSVGIVRQMSKNEYSVCTGVNGGNPEFNSSF